MSSITLRSATPSDIPRMASLIIDSFSAGPWGRFLFPPHLRVKPERGDEFDFRLHKLASMFDSPGREHVCATIRQPGEEEDEAVVVGWAQWIDSEGDMGPEEQKEAGKEGGSGAHIVPGLDKEALARLTREGEFLEKRIKEYLVERGTNNARLLNLLLVDPSYQRKGIGRLLVQEGLNCAAKAGKHVYLRSTPQGRPLYLSLGFEEVLEQKVIGESQHGMVWRAPVAIQSKEGQINLHDSEAII
ncbi:hypothetical protein VP1G_07019 [Cytospora mali]|uniref:N-acetyltransferase domain-containing protein n=1 Tax=Cytospora mali TaxID=578113 RepID=A0A194V7C2_CYTMA|nr:hypothetical protein VP1G_07019 [Valsa mali var. pyri (nom. inval.)]